MEGGGVGVGVVGGAVGVASDGGSLQKTVHMTFLVDKIDM